MDAFAILKLLTLAAEAGESWISIGARVRQNVKAAEADGRTEFTEEERRKIAGRAVSAIDDALATD